MNIFQGKIIRGLTLLLFLASFFVQKVDAHLGGQPAFLKINGAYTILYPVLYNAPSASGFTLPEDNAPDTYPVRQPLHFELDKTFLPLNQHDIESATYTWDFGDGTKAAGLIADHTYPKIGSYVVTVEVHNAPSFTAPFPQFAFESVLVNIFPLAGYEVPHAVMQMNGNGVRDPLSDHIWVDFHATQSFTGSSSRGGSATIASYVWDFGDQTMATGAAVTHLYDGGSAQVYPILRIIDTNGFISDTFMEVDDTTFTIHPTPLAPHTPSPAGSTKISGIAGISIRFIDYIKRLTADVFQTPGNIKYFSMAIIFVLVFFAGALHALTPGHGKSMMAVFLIGKTNSRILDVFVLALSITLAHTLMIYVLGIVFLYLSVHYPVNQLLPYFDKLTAVFVIVLAFILLRKGLIELIHSRHHVFGHKHEHLHKTVQGKGQNSTIWELMFAGLGGGLTPCIDALALLILSITIHQIFFGLLVVVVFSLGLASSIICLGLLVVIGKNTLKLEEKIGGMVGVYAPIIAGVIILIIGIRLFIG